MTLLTKDQILNASDSKHEDVKCPEWGGGEVRILCLTGKQRDEFEMAFVSKKGGNNDSSRRNIRAKMVALCAIDDKGNRLFTEKDVSKLGDKSAAALDRCFNVARRLSGMTEEDVKELEGE